MTNSKLFPSPEDYFIKGKLYSYINASLNKNFYSDDIENSFYTKLNQCFIKKESDIESTYYEYDCNNGRYKYFYIKRENNTLLYLLSELSGQCAGYVVYFWYVDKIIFCVYRQEDYDFFKSFNKL